MDSWIIVQCALITGVHRQQGIRGVTHPTLLASNYTYQGVTVPLYSRQHPTYLGAT